MQEALITSAYLRLPQHMLRLEKNARVHDILQELVRTSLPMLKCQHKYS